MRAHWLDHDWYGLSVLFIWLTYIFILWYMLCAFLWDWQPCFNRAVNCHGRISWWGGWWRVWGGNCETSAAVGQWTHTRSVQLISRQTDCYRWSLRTVSFVLFVFITSSVYLCSLPHIWLDYVVYPICLFVHSSCVVTQEQKDLSISVCHLGT